MRRLVLPTVLLLAVLVGAGVASGELSQQGNLRLAFNARIAPIKLPRKKPASVTMQVSGAIRTANGDRPPELRKIAIAVNRYGHVSTRGLPVCDQAELEQTTSKGSLEACRGSLVGHGHFRAYVMFPGLSPVAVNGQALLFNASKNGRPALDLHIYAAKPVQITFVVPFTISRLHDSTYGTVFTARIPRIAASSGYVTNLSLTLFRRYRYGGQERSFLSARCAVPDGVPGTVFTLARGSFVFANGQRLTSTLERTCWAR
jgi:hypothetical protein